MRLLLVVEDWISFYNQAESLSLGLTQLGIEHQAIRVSNINSLTRIGKEFRPDFIIGVGSWYSYPFFVEQPQKLGFKPIPWIVSNGGIYKYINKFNQLNLILTPSNYCKNIFVKDGVKKDIIKVIPEAVDPHFWYQISPDKLNQFLRLFTISSIFPMLPKFDLLKIRQEKIPLLLTIGGDATSKGAQEVIQALAQLDPRIPWIYLIKTWPQSHTFKRALEEFKLLKKLKFENRVRYLTGEFSREFIRGLISACDIYVAPSRGEGFGLPLVQAQMCGKPIISINALSIKEVVLHQKTGFLAKTSTKEGITKAEINDLTNYLNLLLTNEILRKKMGKAGQIQALKNYSPQIIAQRLIDLLA